MPGLQMLCAAVNRQCDKCEVGLILGNLRAEPSDTLMFKVLLR